MVKSHLIAGMVAIMSLGGVAATGHVDAKADGSEKDTRIIVEVDKDVASHSQDEIKASQKNLLKRIRSNVTTNFEERDSFTLLNNAIVLDVNANDVASIKQLRGVKSVTIDKPHAYQSISSGKTYVAKRDGSSEVDENISAVTMKKPTDTNEGAGTVIAILDNEFFFRGTHVEDENCSFHKFDLDGEGNGCNGSAVYHEVFSPLDSSVPTRFTYNNLASTIQNKCHARRDKSKPAGYEGSLYFNNKVPFYYDYGGESKSYGKAGAMDYDVSSIVTYHGSHVASITGANAPTYKGIAPNAQLACMKVFTNYIADETSKNLGFSDSSGAYDSCILAALEDCIALDVDGINMSLGSDLDDFDSDSITLKTLTKLANQGIMSAISAGNSGKTSYSFTGSYGNWTTDMVETGIMSSYANNAATTTVASGQPTKVFYKNAIKLDGKNIAFEDQITNREGYEAEYQEEFFLSDLPEPVEFQYIPGFGSSSDYAGFSAQDLEGKVFIVNRGSTSFADKYNIAANKGAIGLIIINNDPTSSDFNFRCSFGDDFNPTMPCALVLFKDRESLANAGSGTFTFIKDEESDNPEKYTMSTFSTDGATYNYDLKPEITAPGDNIRGAVPPQTKEHKATPLASYEYLSGTSMSAPNLAGAQAVMLSKLTKDDYSFKRSEEVVNYRKSIDMRIQSTADPMFETDINPENGEKNFASPRLQGAGMVDLDGAYHTDVYLEGLDEEGNGINKAKVVLRNNEDISKGDVKLSFLAHNESNVDKDYRVKLTVMRPAIKNSNLLPTKDYSYRTEISDIKYLPGISYYDVNAERQMSSYGQASYKDVYKLTKDIEYYPSKQAYLNGEDPIVLKTGMWYVASEGVDQSQNIVYKELPGYDYQSTQDVVIATINGQLVTAKAGEDTLIEIDTYSLSESEKAIIAKYYPYGCAIEGFVTLDSVDVNDPDLNIPYLGFYAGDEKSYKDAPVVEPFDFEKDSLTIYPSYLVNDLAKSLVGKDNVNMSSSWAIGYADNPETIVNRSKTLTNDLSIYQLKGFHEIGLDPTSGEYNEDAKLYVGNPKKTNTMLIQQYVMRSVNDNYFTITNKETQEVVYKSVLEDSLYGEQYGRYPLYKSHVDSAYLSAGYIGHRAEAAVPLYDPRTNVPFASGEYEITFNYQLVGYGNEWVKKSYTLVIDSSAPEFDHLEEYYDSVNDAELVRFYFKDAAISSGVIGYRRITEIKFDSSSGLFYMEMDRASVIEAINEIGMSSSYEPRLYVQMTDKAYGETGVVIHFLDLENLNKYNAIAHSDLGVNNDFIRKGTDVSLISIDAIGRETSITLDSDVDRYDFHIVRGGVAPSQAERIIESVETTILPIAIAVISVGALLVAFLLLRKRIF